MKKVLVTLALILVLGITFFIYLEPISTEENSSQDDFPTFLDVSLEEGSTEVNLKTSEGSIVVRNFMTDPRTIADPVNPGHYQLGTFVDPASADVPDVPYHIEFIADTQYFIISLQQEPIAESRIEAEQFLLEHLNLTEDQLCTINYMVSVPSRVNLVYPGQSLGFSFCPGAVAI